MLAKTLFSVCVGRTWIWRSLDAKKKTFFVSGLPDVPYFGMMLDVPVFGMVPDPPSLVSARAGDAERSTEFDAWRAGFDRSQVLRTRSV